jgi:hypothetical protein
MTARPPVLILLHVEAFGGSSDETYECDRTEWEGMTPEERYAFIDGLVDGHMSNAVSAGWHIEDPDDFDSVGGPAVEEAATRRVVEAATAYYWASGTPDETDAHNDLIDAVAALVKGGAL